VWESSSAKVLAGEAYLISLDVKEDGVYIK